MEVATRTFINIQGQEMYPSGFHKTKAQANSRTQRIGGMKTVPIVILS